MEIQTLGAQAKQWRALFAQVNADCLFGYWLCGNWEQATPDEFVSFGSNGAMDYYAEQIHCLSNEQSGYGLCQAIASIMIRGA